MTRLHLSLLSYRPQARIFLLMAGTGSLLALSAAFIAQFVFLLKPCHLCLLQRYPHALVGIVGVASAWRVKNVRRLRILLAACGLVLMAGTSIAVYHSGVEAHIFPGPSGCTSTSTGNESLEEMRRQIMDAPLVSCDQPMGHVFGLSLAVWSALIYTFLTILAFYGVYRSNRLD